MSTFVTDSLEEFQEYVDTAYPRLFYEKRDDSSFILWAGRCSWKGTLASEKEVDKLEAWISKKKAVSGHYETVEGLFTR
jgi:hypothetical protein